MKELIYFGVGLVALVIIVIMTYAIHFAPEVDAEENILNQPSDDSHSHGCE